jgi:hypothetical protein
MPTASLDLPFAVPAKERDKAFTPSMEVAAMILQAEAKRGKQGLFGAALSKISFVSKLYYPLWAVPWENRSLIVDGLGASISVIAKQQLPNVTLFIEDIERGASIRELFRSALEKHLNMFSDFAGRAHVQVDSLVADNDLLTALTEYVKEAASDTQKKETAITLAPFKLDLQATVETATLAQNLEKEIRSEIASLEYARRLLDETTKFHEQMILREISNTREIYDDQIVQLKPAVEKKRDQLIDERDSRVAKMNRIKDTELRGKESEKARRERELQKLELSKADLVKKREARERRHDKVGEAHWEHRIRANENKADEVKARIRALAAFIEKTSRQSEEDIEKIRQGYRWLIDQETRKITDIEAQRDEAVGVKQREIEALKLVARKIGEEIGELGIRKREEAEELRRLSVIQQFDDVTLLCLPFYLAGYQTENKTRFQVFPPVKVLSSEGVMATIRKKLGDFRAVSRASLFLQTRSKSMNRMLNLVQEKMESDKAFSGVLVEAAVSSNIMLKDGFKETLSKGVAELKAEGWITSKEEDFVKAYR